MTDRNLSTVNAAYDRWATLAATVEPTVPSVPIIVLLGEAQDLAEQVDRRWHPTEDKVPLPGLMAAVAMGSIPETLAQDLRELAGALTRAHGEYRAVTEGTLSAPVERGEFLLSEIRQCLDYVFETSGNAEHLAQLTRLNETHNDTSSHDALAMSLEGFALFASHHRERLAQIPEFDPAMLDEAIAVAARLRDQSALKLSGAAIDRQRTALAERNRLITLLTERMSAARRALRFIFRNHPEIARLASSAYERNRRAASRAGERELEEPGSEVTPGAPAVPAVPAVPVVAVPVSPAAVEGAKSSPFVA